MKYYEAWPVCVFESMYAKRLLLPVSSFSKISPCCWQVLFTSQGTLLYLREYDLNLRYVVLWFLYGIYKFPYFLLRNYVTTVMPFSRYDDPRNPRLLVEQLAALLDDEGSSSISICAAALESSCNSPAIFSCFSTPSCS